MTEAVSRLIGPKKARKAVEDIQASVVDDVRLQYEAARTPGQSPASGNPADADALQSPPSGPSSGESAQPKSPMR
eukprot:7225995-Prorocentrum_lima.AAC.1